MDLTGQRFGRLVVVRRDTAAPGTVWICACDCGKHTSVQAYSLRSGDSKSCGCGRSRSHFIHGHAKPSKPTREYSAWSSARQRCNNPNDPGFHNYGGRGIRMTAAWDTFAQFFADMGPSQPHQSLDRIDPDGPYSIGNCRWASRVTQANNTRRNARLTVHGRSMTLAEASRAYGVPYARLRRRLGLGWPADKAVHP